VLSDNSLYVLLLQQLETNWPRALNQAALNNLPWGRFTLDLHGSLYSAPQTSSLGLGPTLTKGEMKDREQKEAKGATGVNSASCYKGANGVRNGEECLQRTKGLGDRRQLLQQGLELSLRPNCKRIFGF